MATRLSTSNNRKMILTTAGVLVVGLGAYGLGRVYPPLGPSSGTIAPAERYVNPQISDKDVTLGDTAVPELMQTDAFELMVKDPSFRALAASPGFQALASQPQVMAAAHVEPASIQRARRRTRRPLPDWRRPPRVPRPLRRKRDRQARS